MDFKFDSKGMAEINRRIEMLGREGQLIENEAIREGAVPLKRTIETEVPVSNLDGPEYVHIKDDIVVSGIKKVDDMKVVEVGPSKKTAWRAKFLEYGTIKMSPRPFMERSYQQSKDNVIDAIRRVLIKGLNL